MEPTKVALGLLLLVVSSALIFATSSVGSSVPLLLVAIASVGMALGALVLGTAADRGRPV